MPTFKCRSLRPFSGPGAVKDKTTKKYRKSGAKGKLCMQKRCQGLGYPLGTISSASIFNAVEVFKVLNACAPFSLT